MNLKEVKEVISDIAEVYRKEIEENDIEDFDYDEFKTAISESLNSNIYVHLDKDDYSVLFEEFLKEGYQRRDYSGPYYKEANVEEFLEEMLISKIEEITGIEDIYSL